MNSKCGKCGSEKIIPLANVLVKGVYSNGTLKAVVLSNPGAWTFIGAVYAKLKANICGECGYTELIAEEPAALYDAYLKAKQ